MTKYFREMSVSEWIKIPDNPIQRDTEMLSAPPRWIELTDYAKAGKAAFRLIKKF